jgi:hypothetical protein
VENGGSAATTMCARCAERARNRLMKTTAVQFGHCLALLLLRLQQTGLYKGTAFR